MGWDDNTNIWYWNGGSATTTGNTNTNVTITGTWASCTNYATGACWTSNTNGVSYVVPTRRTIYVEMPEHYTDQDREEFADLLNNKANLGWKIKAIIKGKVCITDPNDEVRSLADFIPLLVACAASEADVEKLNEFVAAHPLEAPADDNADENEPNEPDGKPEPGDGESPPDPDQRE